MPPTEPRQEAEVCPLCGQSTLEGGGPRPYCAPSNCAAWAVVAVFDHASRRWVPVDGSEAP